MENCYGDRHLLLREECLGVWVKERAQTRSTRQGPVNFGLALNCPSACAQGHGNQWYLVLFEWNEHLKSWYSYEVGKIGIKRLLFCSFGNKPGRNSKMTEGPLTHEPGSKVRINSVLYKLPIAKEKDISTLYFSRWIINKLKPLTYSNGIANPVFEQCVGFPSCVLFLFHTLHENGMGKNFMSVYIKNYVHSGE